MESFQDSQVLVVNSGGKPHILETFALTSKKAGKDANIHLQSVINKQKFTTTEVVPGIAF